MARLVMKKSITLTSSQGNGGRNPSCSPSHSLIRLVVNPVTRRVMSKEGSEQDVKLAMYPEDNTHHHKMAESRLPQPVLSEPAKMWPGEMDTALVQLIIMTDHSVNTVPAWHQVISSWYVHLIPARSCFFSGSLSLASLGPLADMNIFDCTLDLDRTVVVCYSAECLDSVRPAVSLVSFPFFPALTPSFLTLRLLPSPIWLTTFHLCYATIGTRVLQRFTNLLDGVNDVQMSWDRYERFLLAGYTVAFLLT